MKTKEFITYCLSFYGKKGLYPDMIPGVTRTELMNAIAELALTDHHFGGGDSVDREAVRDMVIKMRRPS